MFRTTRINAIELDAGPATLVPLVHVPLLKKAPRNEGEYKVIKDRLNDLGELCHFYGDFSGYHIYLIASTYKKRIVEDSINYYDKKNGLFSLTLEVTLDTGENKKIEINGCQCPLMQKDVNGITYPNAITVEQFSVGTPDALMFHFPGGEAKFRFSSNLIPDIPDDIKFQVPSICDLKIEYVGKAVGQDGTREIADRLGDGHSTESAILNELTYKKTNLDAFSILYKPTPLTVGKDGPLSDAMSFTQVVDILEKSLISRFLPVKNTNSRNFPDDMSVPARLLTELRVTNLWVKVESPLEYGLLYTDAVEQERVHRFDIKVPSYK